MTSKLIIQVIDQVRNGLLVEGTNLDLKRNWWESPAKLVGDICAMANTHEGNSYIVVGVDEKGDLYDVSLPDDEANIQSQIREKVNPRVSVSFTNHKVENHTLTLVKIPHSKNRPHQIMRDPAGKWWIPIRFGSSTHAATRDDLDRMYEERLNVSSQLDIQLIEENGVRWANFAGYSRVGGSSFCFVLSVDNYEGGIPDYLTKVLLVGKSGDQWKSRHFWFEGGSRLNQPIEVQAHESGKRVMVYVSDEEPSGLRNPRPRPDVDNDTFFLEAEARSGKKFSIRIKSYLIQDG